MPVPKLLYFGTGRSKTLLGVEGRPQVFRAPNRTENLKLHAPWFDAATVAENFLESMSQEPI